MMFGRPETFVIASVVLIVWVGILRFWLLPKVLNPLLRPLISWVPRWVWAIAMPVLVVLYQRHRYPNAEGWVYTLGAGAGVMLGILLWLAPRPSPERR